MKVMNRIGFLILTVFLVLTVFSCDDLMLTDEPITRDNPDDPYYSGTIPGEISITVDGSSYSSGGFAFDDTTSGQTDSVVVVVENTSTTDALFLLTDSNWLTGDAVFTETGVPTTQTTLAAGDSMSITVTFAPTAVDDYTGALTVYSNDSDEAMVAIGLTGSGVLQSYSGTRLTATDLADGENVVLDSYIIADEGELAVGGSITIASGATLTIYNGVTLDMGGSSNQIVVNGTLDVQGTQDEPVELTGSTWGGVVVSGTATIDHAYIKELYTGAGYAVRIGTNDARCEEFTLTNSRVYTEGYNEAIQIYYPASDSTYTISNNIFVSEGLGNQQTVYSTSYGTGGITFDFSYNTIIAKSYDGMTFNILDDEASSYTIANNIVCGNTNGFQDIFYFGNSSPYVTVSNNVYDSYTETVDFVTNVDVNDDNLSWAIYDSLSTIFNIPDLNDYTMKLTSEYPSSSQTTIAELIGALSLSDNQIGAYGNGGTPPAH